MKEFVVLKIKSPTKNKRAWLEESGRLFAEATQVGLDFALEAGTCSRAKIHNAAYYKAREIGLPGDFARMATNNAIAHVRSISGLRKAKQKNVGKPTIASSNVVGLGVASYKVVGEALRISTGKRGRYIWLPLCVPKKWKDRLQFVYGDAKLFSRNGVWFVQLPLRTPLVPPARSGERTVIGIDLGIVRIATALTPDGAVVWNGKPIRNRKEHFCKVRSRLQRHNRNDRVRAGKGKERRWQADVNHKISKEIVAMAAKYANPVIAFERLDGIRHRAPRSKKFNRMVSSWAFRDLIDKVTYKAAKEGIAVVFVDPRGTSRTCPKCGHATRANRPNQSNFRCVSCGYQGNADVVGAINIAARAVELLAQGPPDKARTASKKAVRPRRKGSARVMEPLDLRSQEHRSKLQPTVPRGTPGL